MEPEILERRLKFYYITVILSVFSAFLSFAYNAWRLEVSEDNSTIRTASFQVFLQLAELEQGIYRLHYDGDKITGSPRKGWVSVALIRDLSMLIGPDVAKESETLHSNWSKRWALIETDRQAVDDTVDDIDRVRALITKHLSELD
ncbi:hypothetical protein [Pseudoteredinibacter isoporae]|uniref:Uncharacterized protein n=1 Tax=Pseudoteredinibacter isoporae TaxID=570281 RepID=A0A7X0JT06_9GAMM|nr:hypothetical protein [Pseudoteredinibacter isoporae]MBB6521712.1 hypothetical protein [Pseudoteredinibacter isoporae]NHO87260.1 hypothetical protein [Pseudoteredinibacter isoporae]NIB23108.1 hypothetical protein [Pseudoteredinibacter isoporae]